MLIYRRRRGDFLGGRERNWEREGESEGEREGEREGGEEGGRDSERSSYVIRGYGMKQATRYLLAYTSLQLFHHKAPCNAPLHMM
jgi:hypothetical protein